MNNGLKNALFFTGGIAAGIVTGLLTAPKSGKELRSDIGDEVDELKSKLDLENGEAAKSIQKKVAELKKALSDIEVQMNS